MKSILLAFLCITLSFALHAQEYWSSRNDAAGITADKGIARQSFPREYKLFNLDLPAMQQQLLAVTGTRPSNRSVIITLPNAEGGMEQFEVSEASNFEPALQARFPLIRSFSGRGINDPSATLKLSLSPQGIQTMVFRAAKESEYIESYASGQSVYAVFRSRREKGMLPWTCSFLAR